MRTALMLLPLTVLAAPSQAGSVHATGEEQLAKKLQGRVAGKPVDCIRLRSSDTMDSIDETAFVFDQGSVIYVNRTRDPASIRDNSTLVIKQYGSVSRLCSQDQVTANDQFSGLYRGNVLLTEFIPYRRAK